MGLSTRDVAEAANVLAGGFDVAKYNDEPGDGERYDVRLKAAGGLTQQGLGAIVLRTKTGDLVRLDTLATARDSLGPAVISRLDLQYSGTFFTDPELSLAEAIEIINQEARNLLPAGYQVQMLGRAEEFGRTARNMAFAFGMALILVYMVLASQFDSYLQPLFIMVAQPLAIVGGIVALWLFGHELSIYSMIGLVLLMGLASKTSILLVDLTNQLRRDNRSVNEALLEACPRRLRPVLMTSLTVVIAMAAPALGFGAGVEVSGPLAVAVAGGMISSTALTLLVVPAVYSLVENMREKKMEHI